MLLYVEIASCNLESIHPRIGRYRQKRDYRTYLLIYCSATTGKLNRASWKLVGHQTKAPRLKLEPVCERFHSRTLAD
jgi:hypothetical protein